MSRKLAGKNRGLRTAIVAGLAAFGSLAYLVERGLTLDIDLAIRAAIHRFASPALTVIMRLFSTLGSGWFLVPLAVIAVMQWGKRDRFRAHLFVFGSLSAEAVSDLLKFLFHRLRPEVFFDLRPSDTYSFPSGHAFTSTVYFGLLASLAAAGPWRREGVIVLALFIGTSRVYLGYHYPSDVLGGWALATVWLAVCAILAARRGARPRPPAPE